MQLKTEKETAALLGISVHKLQRDRRIGSPLKYRKIGKSVRYLMDDIVAFVEAQTFTSTSAYKK